jgi:L-glyceraldehyde 3-phosphate reductase
MSHTARGDRYQRMLYRRCGRSGVQLPALSLGLWYHFGGIDDPAQSREVLLRAFDAGITHFDLANNYGPPPGSAELTLGSVLKGDLRAYRDELFISTKAGWDMWPGPYGDFGSRKYLIASLDQSLRRLGLEYVDVFYHHRPDPDTPLEETLGALEQIWRQGKALYIGVSAYDGAQAARAIELLRGLGVRCFIHQVRYSLLHRAELEGSLERVLLGAGVGAIAFSALYQGVLTGKYLQGVPAGSRAARPEGQLQREQLTPALLEKVRALQELARARGQSLAQFSLAWVLRNPAMVSVLIGARDVQQLEENLGALANLDFSPEELARIDAITQG